MSDSSSSYASSNSRRRFLKTSAMLAGALSFPIVGAGADKSADKSTEKPEPTANAKVASTTQNTRLKIALVGCGGQGRHDMRNFLSLGENIAAVCDVDDKAIAGALKDNGENASMVKTYSDYRKLLDDAKNYDAVLIGTPDHWHAPLCKAFIQAGKHVYCEKPLTHDLSEARMLRELVAKNPKIVTQTGNQGSAEPSLRRSVELIRTGALGQIHNVYAWLGDVGYTKGKPRPSGEDAVPTGFNWDFWCGPSPYRPYKKDIYHPFSWRAWYDFGNGQLADFTCHIFNTVARSLDLGYAHQIEVSGTGLKQESQGSTNKLKMHFAARKSKEGKALDAMTLHWFDSGPMPDNEILKDAIEVYKKPPENGTLIVGEKGSIYASPWNAGAIIKLNDDPKLRDVMRHEPTKDIPKVYPRGMNHFQEFVAACKGTAKTWSDFEFGGYLTEIGLAGVMALRLGQDIKWDGEKQQVVDGPDADHIIRPQYRKSYLL